MDRKNDIIFISAIAAVALAVLGRQLVTPALYACLREDTVFYINWTRQFADALADGVWYPRWMSDSHGGYGNPTFVFYPPLTVFLTALLKLATRNIILAATAIKFAGFIMSGIFMFVFVRGLWGRWAGLAGGLAYMLLPFRVYDMYFLGIHSSKLAYAWFPIVMHFAGLAASEDKMGKNTSLFAASYSGLCLTHLLSAYMITPVLFAFGLARADSSAKLAASLRLLAGIALGMLAVSFYLLPVLIEQPLVHFEMLLENEIYHYWNNYLFFIMTPKSPYNPEFYGYLGMTVKTSLLACIAAYMVSMPLSVERRRLSAFFIVLTGVTVFLMTSLSAPLWEYLPGMKMLQFSTRWASVAVFSMSCLIGVSVGSMSRTRLTLRPIYTFITVTLLLVSTLWAMHYDINIISRSCRFDSQDISDFPADLDVYEYVPANVSLKWLKGRDGAAPEPRVSVLGPEAAGVDITRWGPQARSFTVDSDSGTALSVRTFYYPGWRAYVDGVKTDIDVQPVSGAMLIRIPAGKHEVALEFGSTPVRTAGWIVSVAALLIVIVLLRRGRKPGGAPS